MDKHNVTDDLTGRLNNAARYHFNIYSKQAKGGNHHL